MEEKKNKVLFIDDEPDITGSLEHFFSKKGYSTQVAMNGEQALQMMDKEKADLIVLDMMMPGMHGDEVAATIKEKYPETKILIVTAYPSEAEKLAQKHLAEWLFLKPVSIEDIYNHSVQILGAPDPVPQEATHVNAASVVKGKVMELRANIVFVEPEANVCTFIGERFKELSHRGEFYELARAVDDKQALQLITHCNVDVLCIDADYLHYLERGFIEKLIHVSQKPFEIVLYHATVFGTLEQKELEKLEQTLRTVCLKNGLLEIKEIKL